MNGTKTEEPWHVYMVRCNDGTLYTGIAKDVAKRIGEHNGNNTGARYTRGRSPVKLVYVEEAVSRAAALKREYRIKRLSRPAKIELIVAGSGNRRGVPIAGEAVRLLRGRYDRAAPAGG